MACLSEPLCQFEFFPILFFSRKMNINILNEKTKKLTERVNDNWTGAAFAMKYFMWLVFFLSYTSSSLILFLPDCKARSHKSSQRNGWVEFDADTETTIHFAFFLSFFLFFFFFFLLFSVSCCNGKSWRESFSGLMPCPYHSHWLRENIYDPIYLRAFHLLCKWMRWIRARVFAVH